MLFTTRVIFTLFLAIYGSVMATKLNYSATLLETLSPDKSYIGLNHLDNYYFLNVGNAFYKLCRQRIANSCAKYPSFSTGYYKVLANYKQNHFITNAFINDIAMTVILNKNLEIVDSYPLGTFIQGFTYSHDNGSSGVYKQKKNFKLFIDLVKLNEPSYKVGQIVNYRDQVLAVDYQGGIHTSKMYLPLKNISPVMSESSNSDLIIYTANVIYIYHNLFKNSSLTEIKSKSGVFKSYCSTKSYIIYSEESEISIYDKNLRISSKIDAKNNNNEQILCDTESDSFMSLSHDKRNGIRYDLIGK